MNRCFTRLLLMTLLLIPSAPGVNTAQADESQAAKPKAAQQAERLLFDGKTLEGWKVTEFAGHGEVKVENGELILGFGEVLTGVTWKGEAVPRENYEVQLQAKRVDGTDFFCGLTFPVGDDPCSFILGGWGGGLIGLSSLNGADASENETTQYQELKNNRWYDVRVRVTTKQIQVWLDKEQIIDVDRTKQEISIRTEVELSKPLGIASYQTTAALRNITLRQLPAEGGGAKK